MLVCRVSSWLENFLAQNFCLTGKRNRCSFDIQIERGSSSLIHSFSYDKNQMLVLSCFVIITVQSTHYDIGYITHHQHERDQLISRCGLNAKQFGKGSSEFEESYHLCGNIYTDTACFICAIHGFLPREVRFSPILGCCIYMVILQSESIGWNYIGSTPS